MTAKAASRVLTHWSVIFPLCFAVACGDRSTVSTPAPEESKQAATETAPQSATAFSQDTPEQLDLRFRALEAAGARIPRDTFDPEAIVQKIGKDPSNLFEWVRDNTYWVPYRGALRGPVGGLMDRLGNSLDRSLLLAELLRNAGHEVHLARGAISADRAEQLLAQIRRAPRNPLARPAPAAPEAIVADIHGFAKEFQLDSTQILGNLADAQAAYRRIEAETKQRLAKQPSFLIKALGAPKAGPELPSKSIALLTEHWWVQMRKDGQWIDLDTLLPNAKPGSALATVAEVFPYDQPSGEIPLASRFVHEISIRVVVEKWKDGSLSEEVALDHSFRPSEVFGETIGFQNIPLNWDPDSEAWRNKAPLDSIVDDVLGQTEWLPQLCIGDRFISQASVNERGDLNFNPQPIGSSDGPGGMAETLGGFDAFGGGEETSEPEEFFTAQWIEYEIRVPGEEPRRIRREIFNMLSEESRSAATPKAPTPNQTRRLDRALNLMGSVFVLPVVSRPSHEYAAYRTIREDMSNRKVILGIQAKLRERDTAGASILARGWKPTTARLFDLSLARFEWNEVGQDVYLDAPNILTYRRSLTRNAKGDFGTKQGFDIVSNRIAVAHSATATPFATRVTQGITDTNVEAVLIGDANTNVGSLLQGRMDERSWVTLRAPEDLSSLGTNWPADARARVTESLKGGYIIVAPRSLEADDGRTRWAWWQVDPTTGETLGIGEQGWGNAATEKPILSTVVIKNALIVGAITAEVVTIICMAKKVLKGEFPPPTIQEHDAMWGDCVCAGVDAGANAAGIVIGAAEGTIFIGGWLGGVTGAAAGVGAAQAAKEALCG